MAASANAIKLRRSNKIQKSTGEKVSQFFIYFSSPCSPWPVWCRSSWCLSSPSPKRNPSPSTAIPSSPTAGPQRLTSCCSPPAPSVPRAYGITIFVTVVGTVVATLITFGAGYTLANKQCRYRNGLSLYFYITMVFSAGLVPWYMISQIIGCYNNICALIVPSLLFSPFNMFLVRNFVRGIPDA